MAMVLFPCIRFESGKRVNKIQNFRVSRYKSVAIIQNKNLGDCVLTTPLVRKILQASPEIRIVIICKSRARKIFLGINERVSVVSSTKGPLFLIRVLRSVQFGFLTHPSSRFGLIFKLLGIPYVSHVRSEKQAPLKSWLEAGNIVARGYGDHNRHTADKILDLARVVGLETGWSDKRLEISHLLRAGKSCESFCRVKQNYIVVHAGSRWMYKTPPYKFWVEVLDRVSEADLQVVLTGSAEPAEMEMIDRLSRSRVDVVNLGGQTTIEQLAALIAESRGYLGVDTFASHLAAALSKPGLVIFGPSSEQMWGPWGLQNSLKVFSDKRFSCLGCQNDGCGGSKFSECLSELNSNEVASEFMVAIDQCV